MRIQTLGRTGMQVSRYCLGTMMFGKRGNPDHDDCIRTIHAALDAGINFVDTSDSYSRGEAEEIVGQALKGRRDNVVLATKIFHQMGDDPNMQGSSRRWIVREVENSLRRLQTDWIDLYQVHRPDPTTAIDETLGALNDLMHQGKVRAIGSSTFPAEQIVEAQWAAERRALTPFACEQPPYSIFVRGIERDVLPTCARYGMGVITWSPLASGWLTGRYRRAEDVDMTASRPSQFPRRFDLSVAGNREKFELINRLDALAQKAGISLMELALAFVVSHPAVTAAIIGPRNIEQLEGLLACAEIELDDATLDGIDEIVSAGTTLYAADAGWTSPTLVTSSLRRRPTETRSAS